MRFNQRTGKVRTDILLIDTPWGRLPVREAAKRSGIDPATIYSRLKAGKDPFRKQHGNIKHGRYIK